jgi:hypothetical protein
MAREPSLCESPTLLYTVVSHPGYRPNSNISFEDDPMHTIAYNGGISRLESLMLVHNDCILLMQVVNSRPPGIDAKMTEGYLQSIQFK